MDLLKTRKVGWLFGLIMMMALLLGTPQEANSVCANETCEFARCHTVGEGYCLPGCPVSLRKKCDYFACLFGEDCDYSWDEEIE